jgi:hypothetical protein
MKKLIIEIKNFFSKKSNIVPLGYYDRFTGYSNI